MKPGTQKEQPAQPIQVERGDRVYFNHPEHGPCHGAVVCHGKHGATIDTDDGQRHRVYWHDVLGHKERAAKRFSVVDHGEAGGIVEDDKGKRRFVAGLPPPEPEKPDETPDDHAKLAEAVKNATAVKPMTKALPAVLFCRL